jgi:hypothetical protein
MTATVKLRLPAGRQGDILVRPTPRIFSHLQGARGDFSKRVNIISLYFQFLLPLDHAMNHIRFIISPELDAVQD